MMDTLIEHFAGEYRKRLGQETPSDHANYDYQSGKKFGNTKFVGIWVESERNYARSRLVF